MQASLQTTVVISTGQVDFMPIGDVRPLGIQMQGRYIPISPRMERISGSKVWEEAISLSLLTNEGSFYGIFRWESSI